MSLATGSPEIQQDKMDAFASVLCCTANSLALGGPALGAVASEDALCKVVLSGGFTEFRRATETPFNRIFEARVI